MEKSLDVQVLNNDRLNEVLKDEAHVEMMNQVDGLVKKLQEDVDALARTNGLKLKTIVMFEFED